MTNVPLYHFDLVNSRTVADESGQELPDDAAAIDVAGTIARRLRLERPELRNRKFAILVTDEEGEEICRIPLDALH